MTPSHTGRLDHLGDFTTSPRVIPISLLAVAIGLVAAVVAAALLELIGLCTNLFFFQRVLGVIALADLLTARARILDAERRRERLLGTWLRRAG
jgi:hypothetical protein